MRIDDSLVPTFINILLNLIFLNAVQSTHNAFAIDQSIAIDVMGTFDVNNKFRQVETTDYETKVKWQHLRPC